MCWEGEGGVLMLCKGLAPEIRSKAAPRITPCQQVFLLLIGLADTDLVYEGFCLCFRLYFGSGAAVPCRSRALPWSSGTALPPAFPLLSEGKPSSSLMASRSLRTPHLWGRFRLWKSRGHRSPPALFSLGAGFSHLCCFSACAAMAEGCSVPLPAGTQALWSAGCYAMGAEAGRARKTASGFPSEVSRPLGVCMKCCRAGISCSKPWVADNSAVPI